MDDRKKLGRWGEDQAAQYLEEAGFELVERNWRCARGEMDLVARMGPLIVFVEVKTRRGRRFGTPEEGLTGRKAQRLLQLAQLYLVEKDLDVDWRIDLIAVELDRQGKLLRIEHVPNAVLGW